MVGRRVTDSDLAIASAFYPILVEMAAAGKTITYRDLVAAARARHPDTAAVAAALAVSAGRRLDVLRNFTDARGLPDLSSLVVNSGTGEVGRGYSDAFDPVANRAAVFAYDWSAERPAFALHLETAQTAVPRKRVARAKAVATMATFAQNNPKHLTAGATGAREQIIALLMAGEDAESAFADAGALRPPSA